MPSLAPRWRRRPLLLIQPRQFSAETRWRMSHGNPSPPFMGRSEQARMYLIELLLVLCLKVVADKRR
jgi:hypothetical protein